MSGVIEAPPAEPVEGEIILPAAVKRQEEAITEARSAVEVAVARAEQVQVRNQEEANAAAGILKNLSKQRRDIEASRKELVGPIKEHAKKIDEKFRTVREPVEAAEKVLKGKIQSYTDEVERLRRAEEERLRREVAEREAAQRAERERAEAEARAAREKAEAEARAAEEEARRVAQADADSAAAQAALEAAEAKAAELDEAKLQEQTLDALPDLPVPVPVVAEAPKVEGVQMRKVWTFEVESVALIPAEYLVVDEKKIRQAVRDGVRDIPGVRIFKESQVAS